MMSRGSVERLISELNIAHATERILKALAILNCNILHNRWLMSHGTKVIISLMLLLVCLLNSIAECDLVHCNDLCACGSS